MAAAESASSREHHRDVSRLARWKDPLGALVLVTIGAFVPFSGSGRDANAVGFGVAAVLLALTLALLSRRLPAVLILTIAVIAYVVTINLQNSPWAYLGPVVVALYTVAQRTNRRFTRTVTILVALVILTTAIDEPLNNGLALETTLQLLALVGCATGFGDASRSHREYIEAITERAQQAEDTKEAEARRRVAEERIRIARDLHDALAHQIAVINLSSNVASQALRARPNDAEASLATIRQAARTVLTEMAGLLSVLRTDDEKHDTSPGNTLTSPVPGLAHLDQLVTEFTRSGLRVDQRIDGVPREIPGPTDIIAYRLIQEALTNALKHGSDSLAILEIIYQERKLTITVANATAPANRSAFADLSAFTDRSAFTERSAFADRSARRPVSGHGLIGAQERAASVGGTLLSAPGPGPVHRFTATLPIEPLPKSMDSMDAGPEKPTLDARS